MSGWTYNDEPQGSKGLLKRFVKWMKPYQSFLCFMDRRRKIKFLKENGWKIWVGDYWIRPYDGCIIYGLDKAYEDATLN